MPRGATPATHVASGPWCFAGRENAFFDWDEAFPLPPDPYPDIAGLEAASFAANAEMVRLIPILAEHLNEKRGTGHSLVFWETALAPWLLTALQSLRERCDRLGGLIRLYGKESMAAPLLPEKCAFSFRNSLDFMVHGVQDAAYNHYVFSRLLEAFGLPAAWTAVYEPIRPLHGAAPAKRGLKDRLRGFLRRLPFPRVKGFGLQQSLLFSLALWSNIKNNDKTLPLAAYAAPAGTAFCDPPFDPLPLLLRGLPLDLVEAPIPAPPRKKGRIRIMAGEFMQDEAYGLQLGAWREGGGRLVDIQHGGNNGNLRCPGSTVLDYRQHAHLTWGWSSHAPHPVNAVPVPHPLVAKVADKHRENAADLVLVGTEMSVYAYRLKSRPLAAGLVAYRKGKKAFFAALPEHVRAKALYRPYFSAAGALSDAPYVQSAFPDIPLCKGDLMERLLACRLAALDHYGTTMLLALAANIPLVCYWDRTLWGMGPETEKHLQPLRDAGILHPDAQSAAAQAARIWDDVPAWWRASATQAARKQWTQTYARADARDSFDLTRRWLRALRDL